MDDQKPTLTLTWTTESKNKLAINKAIKLLIAETNNQYPAKSYAQTMKMEKRIESSHNLAKDNF